MISSPHILANPGVIGAKVSIASAIVSYCATGLPVVQFLAALFGGLAAVMSMTWIGIQIYDRINRGRRP